MTGGCLQRDGVIIVNQLEMPVIRQGYELFLSEGPIDDYTFGNFVVRDLDTGKDVGRIVRTEWGVYSGHEYKPCSNPSEESLELKAA